MGWEVLNANEEVDIRNHGLSAFEKLPIGNYVEDLAHVKKLGSSTKGKQPPSEDPCTSTPPGRWISRFRVVCSSKHENLERRLTKHMLSRVCQFENIYRFERIKFPCDLRQKRREEHDTRLIDVMYITVCKIHEYVSFH